MAAADAADAFPAANQQAVFPDGKNEVFTARRVKTTCSAQQGA